MYCRCSLILVLLLLFTFGAFNVSASAEPASQDSSTINPGLELNINGAGLTADPIKIDKADAIKVSRPKQPEFSTMSNYNVTGDLMNFNDSLTAADPTDFWFFNVPTDRSILFEIKSSNPDYRVELYSIDWSTGTATSTNFWGSPGSIKFATDLSAGDWGLRVTSTGTVETDYSIHMNAANPSDPTYAASVMSYSTSLLYVVMEYPNNDVLLNGNYIANTTPAANTNPQLNWERNYTFSWDGNYSTRNHRISDARVASVTTPVNYSSHYASSNNAVLIVLKEDTLFTYFESEFRSGPPTYHYMSFVDSTGRTTPRRLDFIDAAGDPDILVYDLNTNKVIDFASNLNVWYSSGSEPAPTVTYYN
ncbi:hypothetical protein VK70_04580 [Paenibacillus durus ATCC 35681]|uniref:Peptidase C-terminal archaeal/bacterial domain-containing protein n=1 Tax=Paenibacillus durus ATCC 35681 TaxID=1333534 RepID=A0A0F7CKG1_PAEDU|nr:hypothetical protein VK70_04580 [Paenibacillus durus ATCC 35681]